MLLPSVNRQEKQNHGRWKDGSGKKSIACSLTQPGFSSQHCQDSTQLSVTTGWGNLEPPSGLRRHCMCAVLKQTCRQNTWRSPRSGSCRRQNHQVEPSRLAVGDNLQAVWKIPTKSGRCPAYPRAALHEGPEDNTAIQGWEATACPGQNQVPCIWSH